LREAEESHKILKSGQLTSWFRGTWRVGAGSRWIWRRDDPSFYF